jgi:hypothetical protein
VRLLAAILVWLALLGASSVHAQQNAGGLIEANSPVINTTIPVVGTTYYVAASGSDSNNGLSPSTPWQTITKVNASSFTKGDSILFNGGDNFSGCLVLTGANVTSNASSPLTVSSYGTGEATITANCTGSKLAAVHLDSFSGLVFNNVILRGNSGGAQYGIYLINTGSVITQNFAFSNLDIGGFYTTSTTDAGAEIMVAGDEGIHSIYDVSIVNSTLHGLSGPSSPDESGFFSIGNSQNIYNLTISGVTVYNIGAKTGPQGSEGNGIEVGGVTGGLVQNSIVHDIGGNNVSCGGPVGMWTAASSYVTFQYDEAYHIQPISYTSGCDWDGFDFDIESSYDVIQYDYSHDNYGAGFLAYVGTEGSWHDNIIRFSIAENNAETASQNNYGCLSFQGYSSTNTAINTEAYNNSCYTTGTFPGGDNLTIFSTFSGLTIANNIFYGNGGGRLISIGYSTAGVNLYGNDYYAPGGLNIYYLGTTYTNFAAFQAASGLENNNLVQQVNPLFVTTPGSTGICGTGNPFASCLNGWLLQSGSPMIGVGANLAITPFNFSLPTQDGFGFPRYTTPGAEQNMGASLAPYQISTDFPTVAITSPSPGSVSDTITISATATDAAQVQNVQFEVDGTPIGAPVSSATSTFSTSWNSTVLANGVHTLTAIAENNSSNPTTSAGVSVSLSNGNPVISGVTTTSASVQETVTWTTNSQATTVVNYGLTSGYGLNYSNSALVTSHSAILPSLTPSTTYHYSVTSVDGFGRSSSTSDATFTTNAPLTYYFSPTGTDVNNCLSAISACQTVTKAASLTYYPGDTLLFQGGQNFTGCLDLQYSTNVLGTSATSPTFTVSSYGTGNFTLTANCTGGATHNGAALFINGISDITVQNFNLVGNSGGAGYGVDIQNTSPVSVHNITMQNFTVTGFYTTGSSDGGAEVYLNGNGSQFGLDHVTIENFSLFGATRSAPDDQGIASLGLGENITNLLIDGGTIYYMGGKAGAVGASGSEGNGIILAGVDGGLVEGVIAHDLGNNTTSCGGPVGEWTAGSANVTFEDDEAYDIGPGSYVSGCDWDGFDADVGSQNIRFTRDYAHDNGGIGFLMYVGNANVFGWGPVTIDHDISENNGQYGNTDGEVEMQNGTSSCAYIFNNDLYNNQALATGHRPAGIMFAGGFPACGVVADNIISLTESDLGTADMAALNGTSVSKGLIWYGNDYNVLSGSISIFGHTSLKSWQAVAPGGDYGTTTINPLYYGPIGTGVVCNAVFTTPCPFGYVLQNPSGLGGAGVDLTKTPLNIPVGTQDFFGNTIPNAGPGSGYNTGAYGINLNGPPNTTIPAVVIIAPLNGAIIGGSAYPLDASASTTYGGATIASMQFQVDGVNYGSACSGSPCTVNLNTTGYAELSSHVIGALATDSSGNVGSATVSALIDNLTYTGPGDLIPTGALAWYGLRAYSSTQASSGASLANVCLPSDTACADITSSTSGQPVVPSALSTCNNSSVICTVKTLYDQSGANECGSAACDQTQATIGSRPTFMLSCEGSLPCMKFNGQTLSNATGLTQANNTYSVNVVSQRLTNSGYYPVIATHGAFIINYGSSANQVQATNCSATANDGTFYGVTATGAASGNCNLYINGALENTTGNGWPNLSGALTLQASAPVYVEEWGIWTGALPASGLGGIAYLNSNQRTFWGF